MPVRARTHKPTWLSASASLPEVAPVTFLDGETSSRVRSRLEVRPYRDGEGVFAEVEAFGVWDDQLAAIGHTEALCEDEGECYSEWV